mgnify:CR=1
MTDQILHEPCGQKVCSKYFEEHAAKYCPARQAAPPRGSVQDVDACERRRREVDIREGIRNAR